MLRRPSSTSRGDTWTARWSLALWALVVSGCADDPFAFELDASFVLDAGTGAGAEPDAAMLLRDGGPERPAPSPWIPCDEDLPIGPTDAPLVDCDFRPPWIRPEADANERTAAEDFHGLRVASCRHFNRDLARRWAEDPVAAQTYLDVLIYSGVGLGQLVTLHGPWGHPRYLSKLACEHIGVSEDPLAMAVAWVERYRVLLGIDDDDITLHLFGMVEHRAFTSVHLEQQIAGLLVFRGWIHLMVQPGGVRQIESSLVPDESVAQRRPEIGEVSARMRAAETLAALAAPTAAARLGVYHHHLGARTYLAWWITDGFAFAYVDAISGAILESSAGS